MAHVLVTGMTASQASVRANARSVSFAALMVEALQQAGHHVVWQDPSVLWTMADLAQYDYVMVGIAPITGLGANRAYGALNVVRLMHHSPNVRYFIDAPAPWQITHSLNSVMANPDSLIKPFYSYRKEWALLELETVHADVMAGVRILAEQLWPETAWPCLPWEQTNPEKHLPVGAAGQLRGMNLDQVYLWDVWQGWDGWPNNQPVRAEHWTSDNPKSSWVQDRQPSIFNEVKPLKEHRYTTDQSVMASLAGSLGALLAPQKNGDTWWSPRYIQALSVRTPVATEWRDSLHLGPSWSVLPGSIEALSTEEREDLALEQEKAYLAQILEYPQAQEEVERFIGFRL